jgi:outer membrane protein assembly factor BamB
VLVLLAFAFPGSATADWKQYRGNAQRTGWSPWHGGSARPVVVWQRQIGGWDGYSEPPMYRSSPVVGQFGTVFVGAGRPAALGSIGTRAHLYAFTSTGQRIWGSALNGYAVYGAPAVGRDGRMMAIGEKFDDDDRPLQRAFIVTEQGRIVSSDEARRAGGSSPLVDEAGDFFYRDPTDLWKLSRLDHRTSFEPVRWASNLGDLTSGSGIYDGLADFYDALKGAAACFPGCDFDPSVTLPPPPYTSGGAALPAPAGTGRCRDVAISLWDRFYRVGQGRLLANLEWDALATPAVGRGGTVAYVPLKHQQLAAVTQGGQVLWRLGWGYQPVNLAVGQRGLSSRLTACRSIDANGRSVNLTTRRRDVIYVRDASGGLTAINGDTGYPFWTNRSTSLVGEPVVLAGRTTDVILIAGERALYAFRGEDGQRLWSLPLDSPALGSPAVANDRIYVATYRNLYAIALTD